jgi:hypothetical protein
MARYAAGWRRGGADQPGWIATVMADPGLPAPTPGDALDRLRAASAQQLGDADFGFELLLPDDEDVQERAGGLFAWCRAFLGGFGLAVGDKPLSEEGKEALGDLANLAAARIEEVDPEQDEESPDRDRGIPAHGGTAAARGLRAWPAQPPAPALRRREPHGCIRPRAVARPGTPQLMRRPATTPS